MLIKLTATDMPALQSPHVLLEGWGTKAVAHSQVILSVAVASQLHNHPSPTLWLFALRVQTLGPSLFRRPPAWPPGGLSTHAPGCFPVITGFTCLPAHQNSGKSARTTPRFSNPEGRAHPASVTNAQQMGVGGGVVLWPRGPPATPGAGLTLPPAAPVWAKPRRKNSGHPGPQEATLGSGLQVLRAEICNGPQSQWD